MSNRILFEDWQKPSNKKLHDFSDYIQAIEDFANKNGGTIQAIDSVKHPFQDIIEKQTIKVELPNKTYIITLEVAHNTGTFSTRTVQAVANDVFFVTVSGVAKNCI